MAPSKANGAVDTYISILPPFIFPLPPQQLSTILDKPTWTDKTDGQPPSCLKTTNLSSATYSQEFATWQPDPLSTRLRSMDAMIGTPDAPGSSGKTATTSTESPIDQDRDTPHRDLRSESPRISITLASPLATPSPSAQPTTPFTILEQADILPVVPRFYNLLDHSTHLIQTNGPYTTTPSGILLCFTKPKPKFSAFRFASSLAAAQDAQCHIQPQGPITTDLAIFSRLWETSISLLDRILDSHVLGLEDFGWGVFGLAAGVVGDAAADPLFKSHKQRLHAALLSLPTLNRRPGERAPGAVRTTPAGRVHTIATANRSVHICATMLVQGIRRGNWRSVRWAHGVRVVEAWIAVLRVRGEEGAAGLLDGGNMETRIESEEEEARLMMESRFWRPQLERSVSME